MNYPVKKYITINGIIQECEICKGIVFVFENENDCHCFGCGKGYSTK